MERSPPKGQWEGLSLARRRRGKTRPDIDSQWAQLGGEGIADALPASE